VGTGLAVNNFPAVAAQESYFAQLQNNSQGTIHNSQLLEQVFSNINNAIAAERQAADNAIATMMPAFLAYPALASIANEVDNLTQVIVNYHQLVNEAIAYGDGMREIAMILDNKLQDPDFLVEQAFSVWGQYQLTNVAKEKIAQKFLALMDDGQEIQNSKFKVQNEGSGYNNISAAQLAMSPQPQPVAAPPITNYELRTTNSTVPIPPVPSNAPTNNGMSKMDVLRNAMNSGNAYETLNSLKQRR